MEHILKQTEGLEADGLSSGIRTRDEQYVLLRGECCSEGNDFLLFLLQGLFQKRVACLAEIDFAVFGDYRHPCNELEGSLCLRHKEVDFSKITCCIKQVRNIRAEEFRELIKNPEDLPLLREFKLLDLVVQLHHFGWLDEGGLS